MKRAVILTTLALLLIATNVSAAHSVSITNKDDAEAGTYTMEVSVSNFQLVPVTGGEGEKGKGHIHYFINGEPALGDYATTQTTFTFTDVEEGDVLSAELVLDNHQPSGTDSSGNLNGQSVKDTVTVGGSQGSPGFSVIAAIAAIAAIVVLIRRA